MKTYFLTIRYLTLASTLSLAACATQPMAIAPANTALSDQAHQQRAATLKNWHIAGKIGIRTPKESVSASLQWVQNNKDYTIRLFGPLGANGLTLIGNPYHVNMTTSNGQSVTASSPEKMIALQTGWKLPVSHLYYWIRGMAVPHLPAQIKWDAHHHLSELTQEGWHIQYLAYTNAHNIDLPSKLSMDTSELHLKIIISEW